MREEELRKDHFYWVKYGYYYTIAQCKQTYFSETIGMKNSFNLIGTDESFEFIELEVIREIDIPHFVDMEKLY